MTEFTLSEDSIKTCTKCKVGKSLEEFRTYGKGRRSVCKDCELTAPISTNEELTVKSSLGFSSYIVDNDTYTLVQGDNMIKLQPHEATALVEWLNTKLYPVVEEESE